MMTRKIFRVMDSLTNKIIFQTVMEDTKENRELFVKENMEVFIRGDEMGVTIFEFINFDEAKKELREKYENELSKIEQLEIPDGEARYKIYSSYGKNDNEELWDEFIDFDNRETREEIFLEYSTSSSYIDECGKSNFIKGKSNDIYIQRDGGDWDEPTGVRIEVIQKNKRCDE